MKLQARHFGRSAASYHEAADMQRLVAQGLAQRLLPYAEGLSGTEFGSEPLRVLEAGVGTGHFTEALLGIFERLRMGPIRWTLTDLSPEMLEAAHLRLASRLLVRTAWLECAAESLSEHDAIRRNGPYALLAAASVLQWVSDLPRLFASWAKLQTEGGLLAVAVYGPEHFREVRSLTGRGLPLPTKSEWEAFLQAAGYESLLAEEELLTQHHETPRAMLRHLRATGVNGLSEGPMLRTASDLRRFEAAYGDAFGDENGLVKLTWHPILLVARRRKG